MELQDRLKKTALEMGAFYFGAADLSLAKNGAVTPLEQPLIFKYAFGISIGVPLNPAVVDGLRDQSDNYALLNYHHHYSQMVNSLIGLIATRLNLILMEKGFDSMPIPVAQRFDQQNAYGLFSHKMTASLAGLGWIGKSCLLITPDRGPRVRWGTVLTNAPLEAGKPIESRCGECRKCVDACPAGAFTGKAFSPAEPREARMNIQRHEDYVRGREKSMGSSVCGTCVYICPLGKPG